MASKQAAKRVVVQRKYNKNVAETVIRAQVRQIALRALGGSRGRGWEQKIGTPTQPEEDGEGNILVTRTIIFRKTGGQQRDELIDKQFAAILEQIYKSGHSSQYKSNPWEIISPTFKGSDEVVVADAKGISKDYYLEHLNLDITSHFDDIYDRENQIMRIHSAIQTAVQSDLHKRFNCVLYGEPGCGKSDILLRMGNMLGPENLAYLKFDATSTTEAGAQRLLLEADYIPPVLIVEEIEKTDEKSLRWLLGVLDVRGEIRKTNFRIGHQFRNVKMLCLATVNNMNLFKTVLSGALASRFPNKIYCPRPDRVVMEQILLRELKTMKGGNEIWIEPTLEFCYDQLQWNDPREIVPVCLCGKERLMDGSFQRSILHTLDPDLLRKLDRKVIDKIAPGLAKLRDLDK